MPAPSQLAPQSLFARDYRVIQLLAEGGMGAVYVAEQLSTGKRRALKVMLPELASDARARQRFELEARIAAQIDSEHVVEVVGAGVDEQTGTPWLAMELLEGQDLFKVVRSRGLLSRDEVLTCFHQLGHALGIAHRKGIVHRDLKPENLFLATGRRIGAPFTLKVLDFGIAKLTQESRATSHRTAAMGSPLWMAPEQTEQAQLTPATDVWAMGLIAFFLLTGRVYWRSANQDEVRLASVLTELLVSPLDPASVRAAQLGATEPLPVGFDAWFARCVARDPTHRFSDAGAAVAALGPGMSYREVRDASQPFATHSPMPHNLAPRIAPTVPLAAFPSSAPSHGPSHAPHSYPGAHAPLESQPGYVAAAHSVVAGQGAGPTSAGHAPSDGFSLGRLFLYTTAFVLALSCTGGMTYGALHAWQSYGPGSHGVTPPPHLVALEPTDAGSSMAPLAMRPDVPIDGGVPLAVGSLAVGSLAVGSEAPPLHDPRVEATDEPEREFPWADGEAHVFRGNGRFQNGIVCDFTLTLNRNGTTLDGFFHWTVREVPPAAAGSAHVGETIDEGVTGTWAPPACNIHTVGSAAGTTMRLRINGEGRVSGRDDGGTRYSGRLAN